MVRSIGAGNATAYSEARDKGLVPRDFFWITVKDRDTGAASSFGIWSGDRPVTLDVVDGSTGLLVERTYQGGLNLDIGPIPRSTNLQIETVTVSLSAIADFTRQIVRDYDARLAPVEIHSGTLDPRTRHLNAAPDIEFLGLVDGAPTETPAKGGGASLFKLTIVSEAIAMLQRANPRKRSYEAQKRRDGVDEFALYSSTVRETRVYWGEAKVDNSGNVDD